MAARLALASAAAAQVGMIMMIGSKAEDRTRGAEKRKISDKSRTTSKPKTTSGKTITAACKCHPCTCSPCTSRWQLGEFM